MVLKSGRRDLRRFQWIATTLLILSGICWVLFIIMFMVAMTSQNTPRLLIEIGNPIYVLARLLLVLGIVSSIYILSTEHNALYAAGALALIVLGVVAFQLHENAIQKQALKGCLQVVSPADNSIGPGVYKSEVKACYTSNGFSPPK